MNWFRRHKRFFALVCFFAVCFAGLSVIQARVNRARHGILTPAHVDPVDRLLELGFTVMLGSLRTIPVDYLWVQATRLHDRREHIELHGVIRGIIRFQPTDLDAYDFQIWNMAYNIQYDAPSVVEGWHWVKDAIALAEDGIARNRNHPEVWRLYRRLGWVYYHRSATVRDPRTDYFRAQVIAEKGENPLLIAASKFERAFREATRSGVGPINPHQLAMWAHAYAAMARELEEPDAEGERDLEGMLRYRKKAIEAHREIEAAFPERYGEVAQEQIARLERQIRLHRRMMTANAALDDGRFQEAQELFLSAAIEWARDVSEDPFHEEPARNLDICADALESLLDTPVAEQEAARQELERAVLRLRYVAAHPHRRSRAAAANLQRAVERLDSRLGQLSRTDYVRFRDGVEKASSTWVRILDNPVPREPGDTEEDLEAREQRQAEGATDAVLRFYSLVTEVLTGLDSETASLWEQATTGETIDMEQVQAVAEALDMLIRGGEREARVPGDIRMLAEDLRRLGDHCKHFIDSGLVDRREVRRVVAIRGMMYDRFVGEAITIINRAIRGQLLPGEEHTRAALRRAMRAAGEGEVMIGGAVSHWITLLRPEPAFQQEARLAEQRLDIIAQVLGEQAIAYHELLDPQANVFLRFTRRAWRALYEFDPGNERYAQNMEELVKLTR